MHNWIDIYFFLFSFGLFIFILYRWRYSSQWNRHENPKWIRINIQQPSKHQSDAIIPLEKNVHKKKILSRQQVDTWDSIIYPCLCSFIIHLPFTIYSASLIKCFVLKGFFFSEWLSLWYAVVVIIVRKRTKTGVVCRTPNIQQSKEI